nr:zinc finger, CCHC-type [Tanacetum cinerariifolium]
MTTSVENNSVFRSFFEKQKLTGPNFIDWYRQLHLVLSTEDKENYLEHPIPAAPVAPPGQQVLPQAIAAHAAWVKGQKEVAVLMLLTIDLEIQRNLAHLGAYDMLQELKAMYSKQAEQELLQTVREFHTCKQAEVSLILVSLNKDFDSLVQNYNMHGMGKTVNELHDMLKLHEESLPKKDANPALHAIRAGRVQKNQKNKPYKAAKGGHGKGKGKMGNASFASKPKTPPPPRKITLQRKPFATNVVKLGIGEGTGLRGSKKLKLGALSLYVGDGHRTVVEAIGTYHLELPSGLVIVLNNCHYAPSITRGVILVSCLFDDGFVNRFDENNVISVSKNNLVYFMAVPRDGIYEIDMTCTNTNDSSMYAITGKRAKINLDSFLLWHCHLGYISKKRIEKLQHDGLLNSIDIESLGKCVSCMSGKMARKPYSHLVKRAKDLLGLNTHRYLKASRSVEDLELIQEEDTNPSIDTGLDHKEDDQEINEPQSDINPIRKSLRTRRAPDRMCLYIDAEEHELGDLGEPANYKAALLDPKSKKWLNAMNVKMQSMKDNDVWVLVELPPNDRTVGSKWLFKKKTDMDGAVYIFKARLVAKGFTQTYRVDYEETFSPVADIRAIRILIAIAVYYDYEIWQMDVKTTFLNGHLFEKVYMEQPKGFVNPKYPNHNMTSRFQQNPCDEDWIAVKKILKYLRNTKDMFLVYGGNMERELRVSCYSDAGYLTDAGNLNSQTGYVFVLNGGAVD